jgi:hypothetical protein
MNPASYKEIHISMKIDMRDKCVTAVGCLDVCSYERITKPASYIPQGHECIFHISGKTFHIFQLI